MTKKITSSNDLAIWLRHIADGIDEGVIVSSSHMHGPDGIARVSITCAHGESVCDDELPGVTIDEDETPATAPGKGQGNGKKLKK